MYDSVLVPTDGSNAAAAAVDHAIDHAERYDATLHVLYVVEMYPNADEYATAAEALRDVGEQSVQDVVDAAEAAGLDDVQRSIVEGAPHRAILDYVDDEDIDLVVMGTHGRTGLNRYLLGSVTEKLVRMSDAPVLTVREHEE